MEFGQFPLGKDIQIVALVQLYWSSEIFMFTKILLWKTLGVKLIEWAAEHLTKKP